MYLFRLDDAAENMNLKNWNRIEKIFDKYNIKPLVGVIPHNQDSEILKYDKVDDFWSKVKKWDEKGWIICMHGYNHVYISDDGGINPINKRSEFAGVKYEIQEDKIRKANEIFLRNNIHPKVFFAPSHTFDLNTLKALKENTEINIISDTIANDVYYENDFYFIPQQSGKVRSLPFKTTTFCYHPNTMTDSDFKHLDDFIKKKFKNIITFKDINIKERQKSIFDLLLNRIYFFRRK